MKKRICGLLLGILGTSAFAGCGLGGEPDVAEQPDLETTESQNVELVVWGAEEDTELMNQIIQSFQKKYQGEANIQISFEVQGESQCKDALIGGLEDGYGSGVFHGGFV